MCEPHDQTGLPPRCCWTAYLDGHTAGYTEGIAEGRRQVEAEQWADATAAVRAAREAIGTRRSRNPYALHGTSAELTAYATGLQHGARDAFRADHQTRRAAGHNTRGAA